MGTAPSGAVPVPKQVDPTSEGIVVKVRMRAQITGTRNGEPWPAVGESVEVGDLEGADLCAAGLAEPVAEDRAAKAEKRPAARKAEKRG